MKISVLLAITATSLGAQANAILSVDDIQLSHIEGYTLTEVKSVIIRAGGSGPSHLRENESAIVEILLQSSGLGHVDLQHIEEPPLQKTFIIHQQYTSPN